MPLARSRVRLNALVIAAIGATGLFWLSRQFAFAVDDAYITFRYAQSIGDGDGFAYNAGEIVLGTSTPLYASLLGLCAAAGLDIPSAAIAIGIGAMALTAAVTFHWLAVRCGAGVGLLTVVLLATFPRVLHFAVTGMETSLYLLGIVSAFALYDSGKLVRAAVVAGFCALIRLDGAAVGAALIAHRLMSWRSLPPVRAMIGFVAVTAPWFAYSLWAFGDVRPHTMIAKAQHPLIGSRWWMLEHVLNVRLLPYLPLLVLGIRRSLRERSPGASAFMIWAVLYVLAFTVRGIDHYLWYVAPVGLALAVLSGFGVHSLIGGQRRALWPPLLRDARVVALGLVAILSVRAWYSGQVVRDAIRYHATVESARYDVARRISELGGERDVVATGAIGIVGWFSRAYVYDLMGLVTPRALGRSLPSALDESRARFVVTEVRPADAPAPAIEGFALDRRCSRGPSIAFLLFERRR